MHWDQLSGHRCANPTPLKVFTLGAEAQRVWCSAAFKCSGNIADDVRMWESASLGLKSKFIYNLLNVLINSLCHTGGSDFGLVTLED